QNYSTPIERVRAGFQQAYGRAPTKAEMESTAKFFRAFAKDRSPETMQLTMATFCQGLISSAEFRYLF
ncbi:MAG: hypothetical protein AAGH89_16885, partial [Verrucomicrobiota bacterium]